MIRKGQICTMAQIENFKELYARKIAVEVISEYLLNESLPIVAVEQCVVRLSQTRFASLLQLLGPDHKIPEGDDALTREALFRLLYSLSGGWDPSSQMGKLSHVSQLLRLLKKFIDARMEVDEFIANYSKAREDYNDDETRRILFDLNMSLAFVDYPPPDRTEYAEILAECILVREKLTAYWNVFLK